jgi:two-component system, LytTR family, sensor kinase
MHRLRHFKELALLLVIWMLVMYGMGILGMPGELTSAKMRAIHIREGVFGLLNFILFYTAGRWLFPPFIKHRELAPMLAKLLLLLVSITLLKYAIAYFVFKQDVLYMGYRGNFVPIYRSFNTYSINSTWTHAWVLCAALAYVLFRNWLEADKRRQLLTTQKQEAELGILTTQLNVHFLMNSLNSLYSLALVRSPQVIDATRTLSHLLSYMTNQPPAATYRSALGDELRYLEDFIAMHRLRTGCDNCVVMEITGNTSDYQIAPLLLVPFVENAFKHGVANQPGQPVTIRIQCDAQQFIFSTHNFKTVKRKDKTGGIGLENVRKRLELVYPEQHSLLINDSEREYDCILQINW